MWFCLGGHCSADQSQAWQLPWTDVATASWNGGPVETTKLRNRDSYHAMELLRRPAGAAAGTFHSMKTLTHSAIFTTPSLDLLNKGRRAEKGNEGSFECGDASCEEICRRNSWSKTDLSIALFQSHRFRWESFGHHLFLAIRKNVRLPVLGFWNLWDDSLSDVSDVLVRNHLWCKRFPGSVEQHDVRSLSMS